MKKLVILCLLILSRQAFAQVKTEKLFYTDIMEECDSAKAKYIVYLLYNDTVKNSGLRKLVSVDTKLTVTETEYSDLKKLINNGYSKAYYDNGQLKSNRIYRNDSLEGEACYYYKNGQLKRKEVHSKDNFLSGNCYTQTGVDTAYYVHEIMPEYPDGEKALFEFIIKNTQYPKEARKKQIKGNVYVDFIIEKTGAVSNVKISKSVHPLLDEEAMRVIRLMKNWKPGMQDDEPERVKFTIPIKFNLL